MICPARTPPIVILPQRAMRGASIAASPAPLTKQAVAASLSCRADIALRCTNRRFGTNRDILHRRKTTSLFRRQTTMKPVADLAIWA